MGLISNLLNTIFPEKKPKTVKKPNVPKEKPQTFKSLFVVGEEFVTFHSDINVKTFAKWLNEEHTQWYTDNKRGFAFLSRMSFDELVEHLYANKEDAISSLLMQYVLKWYIQEHGAFRFTQTERRFLNLTQSHILQVLYGIPEDEVVNVIADTDIAEALNNAEDYKNNWIIGAGNTELTDKILEYLVARVNRQITHFKLISDELEGYSNIESILLGANITNFMKLAFKNITTIPNDAIMKARFKRWDRFNTFADNANEYFREELAKDEKSQRFDVRYLLSIVSNREHIKNDHRHVCVFWGSRTIEGFYQGNTFTSSVEQGAQMVFYRMEDGYVSITLYPAKTDSRRPLEDAIILDRHADPSKLLNPDKRHKLWKDFAAYMEATSLDGNPTFCQKLNIWKLRHCKYYIQENEFMPVKSMEQLKHFFEFLATVGCSGILVFLLQFLIGVLHPDTSISDSADKIIHHLDSTQNQIIRTIEQKPAIAPTDTLHIKSVDMTGKIRNDYGN